MPSYVQKQTRQGTIQPPAWLPDNTIFEGWTGSVAYGASSDNSDMDIVGVAIPPREAVFPHTAGHIEGFGPSRERFRVWQLHHVQDQNGNQEYDFAIYNIVDFFTLVMDNNPNMIDVLFLPRRCVLHTTPMFERVREQRHMFLHRGGFPKFRGYAMSQMSKIAGGQNRSNKKRQADITKYGYSTKFAYHCVRLLLEIEQILTTGDLILDRDSKVYQSIRNGEWSLEKLHEWMDEKERTLETLFAQSQLPEKPPVNKIRRLLMECLEEHYGSLDRLVHDSDRHANLIQDLEQLVHRYRG